MPRLFAFILFGLILSAAPRAGAENSPAPKPYVVGGRVVDAKGKPVPRARIFWGELYAQKEEAWLSTVADEGGRYRIEIPQPLPDHFLRVAAAGFAPSVITRFAFQPRGAPTPIDVTMAPGHWLEGIVISGEGKPAGGVKIQAYEIPSWASVYRTETEGRASWDSFRTTERERIMAPGGSAITSDCGEFRLEDLPDRPIAIEAIAPDGKKALDGLFYVDRAHAPWVPPYGYPPGTGGFGCGTGMSVQIGQSVLDGATGRAIERYTVQTGPDQLINFDPPPPKMRDYTGPGPLRIPASGGGLAVVRADEYLPASLRVAVVNGQFQHESVIKVRLDRVQPRFEGSVVDFLTGAPLAGAAVMEAFWIDAKRSDTWPLARTDEGRALAFAELGMIETGADGRFSFFESAGDRKLLRISLAGYAPLVVPPDERAGPAPNGVTPFALHAEAAIVGPRMFDGRAFPKGSIRLTRIFAGENPDPQAFEDTGESAIDFHGLPAGAYRLHAKNDDFPFRSFSIQIALIAGERRALNLDAELDGPCIEGRTLSGDFAVPYAAVTLMPLTNVNPVEIRFMSDPEGNFRLKGAPPGRYQIEAYGGSSATGPVQLDGKIEIKANARLEIQLNPPAPPPTPPPDTLKPVS